MTLIKRAAKLESLLNFTNVGTAPQLPELAGLLAVQPNLVQQPATIPPDGFTLERNQAASMTNWNNVVSEYSSGTEVRPESPNHGLLTSKFSQEDIGNL